MSELSRRGGAATLVLLLGVLAISCADEAPEGLTARLEQYVERSYDGDSVGAVNQGLRDLAGFDYDPANLRSERVLAAAAILGDGDVDQFRRAVELGRADWRDLLVAAGLDGDDWRQALDDVLGPP